MSAAAHAALRGPAEALGVPPPDPAAPATLPREVVARAQGGDPAAFAALYARYHAAIRGYLHRLFGDADDAEEFAQDTFLKAYRALPATSADLSVGAWLYRIATNVALDAFRHRALVRWEPLDRAFGALGAALGPHQGRSESVVAGKDNPTLRRHGHKLIDQDRRENPEPAALDADLAVRARAVLARLPRQYRVCLELHYYHDRSYDEIAEALGTTRAAVKSLLFRGREAFRHHWEADERRWAVPEAPRVGNAPAPTPAGRW